MSDKKRFHKPGSLQPNIEASSSGMTCRQMLLNRQHLKRKRILFRTAEVCPIGKMHGDVFAKTQ